MSPLNEQNGSFVSFPSILCFPYSFVKALTLTKYMSNELYQDKNKMNFRDTIIYLRGKNVQAFFVL